MTINMFQNLASKYYGLYESIVYLDLNRKDNDYIDRINDNIIQDIEDEMLKKDTYYLDSNNLGSEGIDEVVINNCDFIEIVGVDKGAVSK